MYGFRISDNSQDRKGVVISNPIESEGQVLVVVVWDNHKFEVRSVEGLSAVPASEEGATTADVLSLVPPEQTH